MVSQTLRKYQEEGVDAAFLGWQTMDRVAMEVATGGGKTLVAAEVIKRTIAAKPNAKIVFLAHRGELLRAGQKTISKHCGIQVGVVDGQVAPALRKKHLQAQVVCINTATLGVSKNQRGNGGKRLATVKSLHDTLGNVDLIILDECHRANTDTAMDCLTELGAFSGTRLLGITATLFRTDSKMLTDVFEDCVYKKNLLDLIEEGYLVDIKMKKAHVDGMDLTKVALSRSMSVTDFNATDLDRVMEEAGAEGVIAEFAKRYCGDRKTLVFTPTVAAAERVAAAFKEQGLGSRVVHGSMPSKERAEALEAFEDGDLQFLINCMILTEGVDLPSCSCIIMARPTKSQQLYLQIIGRALRLAEDKDDALLIDLVGATSVNGLVSGSTLFNTHTGETALEAKQRRETIQRIIQAKAATVHAALTPEEQEENPIETIISGSFNLWDVEVEELVEQVKRASKESKARKERERVRTLPSFPSPGRCGSLLELDLDFLLSLESWATLPQYKGSYAAGLCHNDRWYAFYCDKSKKKSDDRRYGFIAQNLASFEEMEAAIIEFTKTFPGTAGAAYYSQNKLQPNHPKRSKKASADQIKFMINLLRRAKIRDEELTMLSNKEMKQPNIGTVLDWIDYLLLCSDAREQCAHVKGWLRDQEKK
jgi:superfamily II DNA or RNA helicase